MRYLLFPLYSVLGRSALDARLVTGADEALVVRQLDDHGKGRNVHGAGQGQTVGHRQGAFDTRFFVG